MYPTQSQTLVGTAIGRTNNSILMMFHNTTTYSVYTTTDYSLNPGRHTNAHFGLTYNGGIFVGTYSSY